jgi:hypothetical protein
LKRLARVKHSSLLQKFGNYGSNEIYDSGPRIKIKDENFES